MKFRALAILALLATVPVAMWGSSAAGATITGQRGAAIGTWRIFVVFVQFSDVKFSTGASDFAEVLNSVTRYYSRVSYGQLFIDWDSYAWNESAWLTLPKFMAYYGANVEGEDGNIEELISDTLALAEPYIDYSTYKSILLVHAGPDEAVSGNPFHIRSACIKDVRWPAGEGHVKLNVVIVSEEDPVGVIAHELGHLLGLPDLDRGKSRVGRWGLMGLGAYNGPTPGSVPAEPIAWSRWKLGWLEGAVVEIEEIGSKTVKLTALEVPGGIKAVKVSLGQDRFYFIEARFRIGYDEYLPGEGVLVTFVDESASEVTVKVVDPTPLDGDLSNAALKPGAEFKDPEYNVTIFVAAGRELGREFEVVVTHGYRQLPSVEVSSNVVEPGQLLSIEVAHSRPIHFLAAWLDDYMVGYSSLWYEERTYVKVDILIPDLEPGNYTLKVVVVAGGYQLAPGTIEVLENVTVVRRVTPNVVLEGPEEARPGDAVRFLLTFIADGEPQDPTAVAAKLLDPYGTPVAVGEVSKLPRGVYAAEFEIPNDVAPGQYLVVITAWKEGGLLVFNCTAARGLVVHAPHWQFELVQLATVALAAIALAVAIFSLSRRPAAVKA